METLWQDLRFALRTLRLNRGFTAAVVLTLALGIGVTTAVFSVVNAVLLKSLGFPEPHRLLAVGADFPRQGLAQAQLSVPEFEELREELRPLADVIAFSPTNANITGIEKPERTQAQVVTADFFDVLGRTPRLGRTFAPADDAGGIGFNVVISYGLWQRFFGGAPDVVGRSIRFDDDLMTVIGVMPPDFRQPLDAGPPSTELWVASNYHIPQIPFQVRRARLLTVVLRLRQGVAADQVHAALADLGRRWSVEHPDIYGRDSGFRLTAQPLELAMAGTARRPLLVLLGAVALVLLIACANVANLLLARAVPREREFAIRKALGAGAGRLGRQLLVESLMLAGAGGTLGVLLAVWAAPALGRLSAGVLRGTGSITVDARVLGFSLAITLATALTFGLLPSLQAARAEATGVLRHGARETGGVGQRRTRALLVVAELALALVLLVGGGLLLRSFARLLAIDPGFRPDPVLTLQTTFPVPNDPTRGQYYTPAARVNFFERVTHELEGVSGVTAAAVSSRLPLQGNNLVPFQVEGRPPASGEPLPQAAFQMVGARYFQVLDIPLLQGRAFRDTDRLGAPPVAVVNRTMARQQFPDGAVGRRLQLGEGQLEVTIVGVVGDVRQRLEDAPRPAFYLPATQQPPTGTYILVRTRGRPGDYAAAAQQAVARVDAQQPVYGIATMDQVLADVLGQNRFAMLLLGLFALQALLLASIGVYGVVAYAVGQRRREIGIRITLGALPRDVLALVLRQGLMLAAGGIVLGGLAALGLTRVLTGLLYSISPTDPLVFGAIIVLLGLVALAACVVPARRAVRTDPVAALRAE